MLMIIFCIICMLRGTIYVNMEISSDKTNTKLTLLLKSRSIFIFHLILLNQDYFFFKLKSLENITLQQLFVILYKLG